MFRRLFNEIRNRPRGGSFPVFPDFLILFCVEVFVPC